MNGSPQPLPPKQTLLLILLPLLGTFIALRLYLHLVRVQHVYPGGYLVHHLFMGVVIVVPAALVLAFEVRRRWMAIAARVALGVGCALMLDEMTFLVMTKAGDEDYVSRLSLFGGLGFVLFAVALLWMLYRSQSR
jgi:heme/copper-type cytochrome/quinol oxidase subunit 4